MSGTGWRAPFRAIDRFFFTPLPQQGMVACRIGLGLTLFAAYAGRIARVPELYGPHGMGGFDLVRRAPEAGFGRLLDAPLRWLVHNPSETLVWALYALLLTAALAFVLGAATRVSGALLLLLHALFMARNQYAYTGWAWMAKPFLLYVVLAPSGRWLSVDAWRRTGSFAGPMRGPDAWRGPGWPVRLLMIHVACMYAVAGGSRLFDPGWAAGEMVFVLLTDLRYARLAFDWHPWIPWLAPLSYVAWVAEPLAPILLWVPGVRTALALVLVALHLGLELMGRLGWWQWLMISALMVFLPPRWLGAAFERAAHRLDRLRPA